MGIKKNHPDSPEHRALIQQDLSDSRDLVERIAYLASLVSRPDDIDEYMEALRQVTAHWDKVSPFSVQDLALLEDLERKLRDYLLHHDPGRTLSAAGLDKQLQKRFGPAKT